MAKPRPVVTYYDEGDRVSHSTTTEAATRAAFSRLLHGDYHKAVISPCQNGKSVAVLKATAAGITTVMGAWK